jgi:hypothetical protein
MQFTHGEFPYSFGQSRSVLNRQAAGADPEHEQSAQAIPVEADRGLSNAGTGDQRANLKIA